MVTVFPHITTVQLSWHGQNWDIIRSLLSRYFRNVLVMSSSTLFEMGLWIYWWLYKMVVILQTFQNTLSLDNLYSFIYLPKTPTATDAHMNKSSLSAVSDLYTIFEHLISVSSSHINSIYSCVWCNPFITTCMLSSHHSLLHILWYDVPMLLWPIGSVW